MQYYLFPNRKTNFSLNTSKFRISNIVIPEANSGSKFTFELIEDDYFRYYSPIGDTFFWSTGDGPLPTVNKDQIEFFRNKFGYLPTQRTDKLRDGFKSIKTDE